ncbi:Uncharacterised protein [Mycobacteroides abscessus subsp. abscessus]|nr:Uncharacterised protein [Mycobacteroides abscessus subsp. abscessus]
MCLSANRNGSSVAGSSASTPASWTSRPLVSINRADMLSS